jgi:hypothetical protein
MDLSDLTRPDALAAPIPRLSNDGYEMAIALAGETARIPL